MKRKKNSLLKEMEPTLTLSGTSLGSSLLGGSLQSKLPVGVSNPLTTTGTTLTGFIPFMATLGVFSHTSKQFKGLNKKMKGGKKK